MPVFMLNHDLTYESGLDTNFPLVPAFIRFILMCICPTMHYSWWKFATCDMSGNLRCRTELVCRLIYERNEAIYT